jgi:hypothetical protein
MPNYSRTRGAVVASQGFYTGSKGSETAVVSATGKVIAGTKSVVEVALASGSAAQTVYTIAPYAGTVTAVYVCNDTAARSAAFTVKAGSAGNTIASITTSTAATVAGNVETMTLGTVTVTAGQSISVARGTQGSTGSSAVSIVIERTS